MRHNRSCASSTAGSQIAGSSSSGSATSGLHPLLLAVVSVVSRAVDVVFIGARVIHFSLRGGLCFGRALSTMVFHIARSQRDLCARTSHVILFSIARFMGPTSIPYSFIFGPIFPKSLFECLVYSGLRVFYRQVPMISGFRTAFPEASSNLQRSVGQYCFYKSRVVASNACIFVSALATINEFVVTGSPLDALCGNKFARPVPCAALIALARQQHTHCDIFGSAPTVALGAIFFDVHFGVCTCRVLSALAAVSLGPCVSYPIGLAIAAAIFPSFPNTPLRERTPHRQNQSNRVWGPGQSVSPLSEVTQNMQSQLTMSSPSRPMDTGSGLPDVPPLPVSGLPTVCPTCLTDIWRCSCPRNRDSASSSSAVGPAPVTATIPRADAGARSITPPTQRVMCPVPGCPKASPINGGFDSHASMRPHLKRHCFNRSQGALPESYIRQHRLQHCSLSGPHQPSHPGLLPNVP